MFGQDLAAVAYRARRGRSVNSDIPFLVSDFVFTAVLELAFILQVGHVLLLEIIGVFYPYIYIYVHYTCNVSLLASPCTCMHSI